MQHRTDGAAHRADPSAAVPERDVTEREQRAIEFLLSEPEIVAWLGADPIQGGDDPDASPTAVGTIEAALASE